MAGKSAQNLCRTYKYGAQNLQVTCGEFSIFWHRILTTLDKHTSYVQNSNHASNYPAIAHIMALTIIPQSSGPDERLILNKVNKEPYKLLEMWFDVTTKISWNFLQFLQRHIVVILHLIQDDNDLVDLLYHAAEQLADIATTERTQISHAIIHTWRRRKVSRQTKVCCNGGHTLLWRLDPTRSKP